jgi:heme exporter protein B
MPTDAMTRRDASPAIEEPASDGPPAPPPGELASALLIARKDLLVEFRTRSAFMSALGFAVLGIVLFSFAWDPTAVSPIDLAPGVMWVIFTLSGMLGLHRSFEVERADGAMDGLLTAPVSRESVFLGKAAANLAFVVAVQAIAIPAVVLFYNLPVDRGLLAVAGVALLAAVGLVAVGTLFSAMVANTRLAELLLPMLALPFFVPIVIPAGQATAQLIAGRPPDEALTWLKLLLAFDIVFLAACMVGFRYTVEE